LQLYTCEYDIYYCTNRIVESQTGSRAGGEFMTDQMIGYLLLALSALIYVICGATFLAMLQALTVSSTISAIESAFGTFVVGILLLVLGRKSYQAGKRRLKAEN
jgi:hypothetical protein